MGERDEPSKDAEASELRNSPEVKDSPRRTVTYGSPPEAEQDEEASSLEPRNRPHQRGAETEPWGSQEGFPSAPADDNDASDSASVAEGWLSPLSGTGVPSDSSKSRGSSARESTPAEEPPPPEIASVESTRHEILYAVRDALARFGVPGELCFERGRLVLHGPHGPSQHRANTLVLRWPHLDEPARASLATQAARSLAQSQRQSKPPKSQGKPLDLSSLALAAVAALLLGLMVLWSTSDGLGRHDDETEGELTQSSDTLEHDHLLREERRVRSCESARGRVFRGGSLSPADADGWVVELGLLRKTSPQRVDAEDALAPFFSRSNSSGERSYHWQEERKLATTEGRRNVVTVRSEVLGKHALLFVTFHGSFVERYFQSEGHQPFTRLAEALASRLDATHSALYARCAHDSIHALGLWFRGADSGAVAGSLLFFMGAYGHPPHLTAASAEGRGTKERELPAILKKVERKTRYLERSHLATVVGSEGGMAMGGPEGPVTLTFPPKDGNRAARASRTMARVLDLAP